MNKKIVSFGVVLILLVLMTFYAATTGSIKVGFIEFFAGLFTGDNYNVEIIKDLRLPRIVIAIFAGATLSVSGVLLQAVVRNPLAEPGIIGIASGASFFTVLVLSFFPTLFFFSPLIASIGGAIAFLIVYAFSWKSGLDPLRFILIGVAVNAVFTSLLQVFGFGSSSMIASLSNLTTSTLAMKNWSEVQVMVIYGSIGLLLAFVVFAWCNYLALEDRTAKSLGLNVNLARFVIAAIAVVLASVATAIAGIFAFVGLLIPHIGRLFVGTDHQWLIPFSALLGALLILVADTLGRIVIAPMEIPASIIMALIGGPFLIFLLRKSDRIYGH